MKNISYFRYLLLFTFASFIGHAKAQQGCETGTLNTGYVSDSSTTVTYKPTKVKPGNDVVLQTGDRVVFWLHGLGGDENSWTQAAVNTQAQYTNIGDPNFFPARKAISERLHYSQFNLFAAGVDLHNGLALYDGATTGGNPFTNNFIICHSQGGPVSRKLDKMYHDVTISNSDRRIGGIVTFGSPHMGARIINNIPLITTFSTEGCNAILAGPVEEKIDGSWPLRFFSLNEVAQQVKDNVCQFFANDVVPQVFKDQVHPITADYAVGALEMQKLNTFQSTPASNTHMVAFYGEEDDPAFWRLMYSMGVINVNDLAPFTADADQQLVDLATENMYKYKLKRDIAQATINNLNAQRCTDAQWYFATPYCVGMDIYLNNKVNTQARLLYYWDEGYQWWLHADDKWRVIIGADDVVTTQTLNVPEMRCQCKGSRYNGSTAVISDEVVNSYSECNDMQTSLKDDYIGYKSIHCHTYTQMVTVINTITTHKASDGVALAESAGGLISRQNWKMPGSNHAQMKNDPNLKDKLNDLYNGLTDPWFKIPAR
jgi:pimeloyl-ACP methyl ester carboxylesterase